MIEPCEEVKRVEQRYEKALDDMEKHYKDVLEKIRDEIEESITDYILDEEDTNTDTRMGDVMTKVFDIIDRYREE